MKICIGIVSWLPDDADHRKQRITRFKSTLNQLDKAFGDRVDYLFIAQNWQNFKLPKEIENKATIFKYDKLGILRARKELRKKFLELNYDYLIMSDDDVILEYKDSSVIDDYINALEKHPQGFMFLQYSWSLNLCAISRWIYEREDMVDIDPEKNEGYEDTCFPNLLHYKYPDKEFKVNGIKFTQHLSANRKNVKSTWMKSEIKYWLLQKRSDFIIHQGFEQGLFDIQYLKKLACEKYTEGGVEITEAPRTIVPKAEAFTGLSEEWWKEDF